MSFSITEDIKTVSDLKKKTSEIFKQMHQTGRPIIVTVNGKPDAVLLDVEVFEKISFFDNIKFRFIETPKYIGGYKNLMPLFVYTFFNLIGRSCAKLKIFKENPVK